jgi:O-6-methylguanine DNA methyltransferase
MFYHYVSTPAGQLLLTGDGQYLTSMYWTVFKRAIRPAAGWVEKPAAFTGVVQQLDEYFVGKRTTFSIEYRATGTPFQQSVWYEIAQIPYGKTTTYQAIAHAIGNPKAVRAVGTAVGSNPMSIIVPCHRVLATSGKLGGYAGGLASKTLLLDLEKIPR